MRQVQGTSITLTRPRTITVLAENVTAYWTVKLDGQVGSVARVQQKFIHARPIKSAVGHVGSLFRLVLPTLHPRDLPPDSSYFNLLNAAKVEGNTQPATVEETVPHAPRALIQLPRL